MYKFLTNIFNYLKLFFQKVWYGPSKFAWLLVPFAMIYGWFFALKRFVYRKGLIQVFHTNVPTIVVGNITVGGTGKTSFVIWLVKYLTKAGYEVAIVTRGYGRYTRQGPYIVNKTSSCKEVGDEPKLIYNQTGAHVVVDSNRKRAIKYIQKETNVNMIIMDDGLQNFLVNKDFSIAVIDGMREFGNSRLLPAGPLREKVKYLREVDLVVSNGASDICDAAMHYTAKNFTSIADPNIQVSESHFVGKKNVHVYTGIGNPEKFFQMLKALGMAFDSKIFPDHYSFSAEDFSGDPNDLYIMTEKDAVKCEGFATNNMWFLSIDVSMTENIKTSIQTFIEDKKTSHAPESTQVQRSNKVPTLA